MTTRLTALAALLVVAAAPAQAEAVAEEWPTLCVELGRVEVGFRAAFKNGVELWRASMWCVASTATTAAAPAGDYDDASIERLFDNWASSSRGRTARASAPNSCRVVRAAVRSWRGGAGARR